MSCFFQCSEAVYLSLLYMYTCMWVPMCSWTEKNKIFKNPCFISSFIALFVGKEIAFSSLTLK